MTANPVDYLIGLTHTSRKAFTKKHGLGKNLLLLLSQGRKESVSGDLETIFEVELLAVGLDLTTVLIEQYDSETIDEAYQKWIKAERAETDMKVRIPLKNEVSPWGSIVDQIGSVSATSKLLKVRWIAVKDYLTSPEMPSSIRGALEDIGWTGIERLDKAQRKHFSG